MRDPRGPSRTFRTFPDFSGPFRTFPDLSGPFRQLSADVSPIRRALQNPARDQVRQDQLTGAAIQPHIKLKLEYVCAVLRPPPPAHLWRSRPKPPERDHEETKIAKGTKNPGTLQEHTETRAEQFDDADGFQQVLPPSRVHGTFAVYCCAPQIIFVPFPVFVPSWCLFLASSSTAIG